MAFSFKDVFASLGKSAAPPTKVVGIDIGSASIKVVEIEKTDLGLTLKTYGELQLGPYVEQELGVAVALPLEQKTEALVDVIREANVQAKSGVLAMPLASSFVTVVPITIGVNEDLAAKIPVEAKKYIPIPLTEVLLDWVEIASRDEIEDSTKEVLLVAVQSEALAAYNELMASVKMTSQPPEIEVFSTIRALRSQQFNTTAIIDLGARVSKLYVVHNDMLERIHRVSAGGSTATKRLADLLGVSLSEAENIKRNYDKSNPHAADTKKAMTVTFDPVLQEFKRIIDQYEARTNQAIEAVIFTGGNAAFPDMAAFAQDALARPITIANPFTQVAYPAFMEDTLKQIGPTFAPSLGAALRVFE